MIVWSERKGTPFLNVRLFGQDVSMTLLFGVSLDDLVYEEVDEWLVFGYENKREKITRFFRIVLCDQTYIKQMTQNIKVKDLLYFKGKVSNRHIILEMIEEDNITEKFKIMVSILK